MKQKTLRVGRVLIAWACTVLLLTATNPAKLPSALLIAPFLFLFVAIYLTVKELLNLMGGGVQNKIVRFKASRPRLIAGIIAAFPVLLLVLQSIGQLTAWDVLMVVALFIVAYFYIIKASAAFPGR
jgi:hypothetical protein